MTEHVTERRNALIEATTVRIAMRPNSPAALLAGVARRGVTVGLVVPKAPADG